MPVMPPSFRPRGTPSRVERERASDDRRGSARERGYDGRWDKARRAYLAVHPVCEYCGLEGRVQAADLVDHLYPHRVYDPRRTEGLFWRSEYWVACCKACHDGPKQRIEASGPAALDALASRLGRPVLER